MQKSLENYRQSYGKSELLEENIPSFPLPLFTAWFEEAEAHPEIAEVNAMSLATCGIEGFPKNRIVLLKSFGVNGFSFYTNYNSEKGKEIEENPRVCLSFFWPALERQVIIKGIAMKTSEEESAAYFASRPRGSQLGAWASNQSNILGSREELELQLKEVEERYKNKEVEKPQHWGGYLVTPRSFEFWQGRNNRLHDRIIYEFIEKDTWERNRLSP
ncbi:pyridoxamine 5'-phosphate oxidase [Salegentibacter salarius]|uniref:Pyridoxine/pyridoxamine 5'-phosphate oxidase n=1 Tax=Salegentibacter salarius TaxID=435906 RepID=A0A2N0TSS5_9FLAO|nr:pyridoxamine 5'-phosphate oxidase [Salegentibacter salarius]OEY72015.1 pyridoxamine 5'-phosphate oxidase [Salegentibacter salarius]PKD17794.1 pyridoxamine 5'-phosphate oxidase [Salegentibacter salarius]SLK05884.1 Pyridoxamine 5'-phosphate oxidase [Salegentibacter salarius]